MSTTTIEPVQETHKEIHQVPSATVRFAGDSGDSMQLTSKQFTRTSALLGNDVSTFPDHPAEIHREVGRAGINLDIDGSTGQAGAVAWGDLTRIRRCTRSEQVSFGVAMSLPTSTCCRP